MNDIVEKLRTVGDELGDDYCHVVYEAANEIERLRVRVLELTAHTQWLTQVAQDHMNQVR